jgi:hypothetical protein
VVTRAKVAKVKRVAGFVIFENQTMTPVKRTVDTNILIITVGVKI